MLENEWLGDNYCDAACNIPECEFDMGGYNTASVGFCCKRCLDQVTAAAIPAPLPAAAISMAKR